jgi:hypothetical protein
VASPASGLRPLAGCGAGGDELSCFEPRSHLVLQTCNHADYGNQNASK